MADSWQPGDPVYQQQPGWLICVCGVQVRWHPDPPTTCPECNRTLLDNLPAAFAAAKTEGRRAGWAEAIVALRRVPDDWIFLDGPEGQHRRRLPRDRGTRREGPNGGPPSGTERRTRPGRTSGHPSTGGGHMTRYRLPAELGGGEVESYAHDHDARTVIFRVEHDGLVFSEDHFVRIPRALLTEVAPPIPDEPEPGAYDIGGVVCVRSDERYPYPWQAVSEDAFTKPRQPMTWVGLWEVYGGPDVVIRRLVPEPAQDVRLPWCNDTWRVDDEHDGLVTIRVVGQAYGVRPFAARRLAAAVWAAAEATDG